MIHLPMEIGTIAFTTPMHNFSEFILINGLVDIPLVGGNFTWSNKS